MGVLCTLIGILGARWAGTAGWIQFFDNMHWTAATSTAALVGWLELRLRPDVRIRRSLRWVVAGLVLYAVGQWTWDLQTWFHYEGFPSPSDALYLWLGPLLTVGLALGALQSRRVNIAAFALDILALAIAFCTFILAVYLPRRGEASGLVLWTLVAYPTTLFAAVAATLIVVPTLRLQVTRHTMAFLVGITGTALSWMNWNYMALDGQPTDGAWFNGGFSVSILLVAWGLRAWGRPINASASWDRNSEGLLRQLPLGVVLIASAAVIASNTLEQVPDLVQNIVQAGAVIIIVLAIVRQGLLLRERDLLIATQTALSQSQQELLKERAHLHSLLNAMPDLVWLKDPEGVYISCNRAFEIFFGAPESQIVGKTDYDFVPRELADSFREHDLKSVLAAEPSRNEEVLRFASTGYVGTFETIKTPMRDNSGRLIGVLGVSRDISERKAAEKLLQVHSGILSNLAEGIHLVRADTLRIVFTNHQLDRMFGYAEGELLGRHVTALNATDSAEQTTAGENILASLQLRGTWEGDLQSRRKNGEVFWTHAVVSAFDHPDHGKVWISVYEDATARKLAEEEVRSLAFFDPLTRLPNRRLMLDRANLAISQSQRSGTGGALFLIDLDNFKNLNDSLGHDVGDQLLVGVAHRLSVALRDGDTVCRLGGDEFVVVVSGLEAGADGAVQAKGVAEKLQRAMNQPHELVVIGLSGTQVVHQYQCSPSIGICMFEGNRLSVDELLKRADTAMYQSKRTGKNAISFYDPATQDAIQERMRMEVDLNRAIFQNEFVLYMQPQINIAHELIGAEVLLRWQHPQRGMVPPGTFIALAEETGQILKIGQWVLAQACQQLAAWSQHPELSRLALAVNVSARQVDKPEFVREVLDHIHANGINPGCLKLEITEGLLLANTEDVITKMEALSSHGVSFSLDDFGTGYSSLSYLKRLPLDQLKIDQSFVRDLLSDANDAVIARTVTNLGHSLALYVVAEGVETREQLELLRGYGCDAYQGYLFGRPMPVQEFEDFARAWTPARAADAVSVHTGTGA